MRRRAPGRRAGSLVFALAVAGLLFVSAGPLGASTGASAPAGPAPASAPQGAAAHRSHKVTICHRHPGSHRWHQITISRYALRAHLSHPWGPDLYPVPPGGCNGPTTSTTQPGDPCNEYTPTHLAVNPTSVAPGGTVTITGIAMAGVGVTATMGSPPTVIGTAVAGPTGQFSITATIPAGTPPGNHQITVTSDQCPAQGQVTIRVASQVSSSCAAPHSARTWQQGTEVVWTLSTTRFDTSRPVKLVLRKGSYRAVLYDGAWPAGDTVTFTVPTDHRATGLLTIEQFGTSVHGHSWWHNGCGWWHHHPAHTGCIVRIVPTGTNMDLASFQQAGGDGSSLPLSPRELTAVGAVVVGMLALSRVATRRARLRPRRH